MKPTWIYVCVLLKKHLALISIFTIDLRVEYAKAKARVSRWHEEILLITEEMRRTVVFLQWKAQWWRDIAGERPARIDIQQGITAYSHRQESQLLRLAEQFANLWRPALQDGCFDISWLDGFLSRR